MWTMLMHLLFLCVTSSVFFSFSGPTRQNERWEKQIRPHVQKGPSLKTAGTAAATAAAGHLPRAVLRGHDGRPGHQARSQHAPPAVLRGQRGLRHALPAPLRPALPGDAGLPPAGPQPAVHRGVFPAGAAHLHQLPISGLLHATQLPSLCRVSNAQSIFLAASHQSPL